MVACSGHPESRMRVTPFRVSILRDRRVVLYAGFRLGEYHAPLCSMAWNQSLIGACHSAVRQGLLLSEYVRVATSGRHHLPVAVGAPLSEFQAIAERYPVYRDRSLVM